MELRRLRENELNQLCDLLTHLSGKKSEFDYHTATQTFRYTHDTKHCETFVIEHQNKIIAAASIWYMPKFMHNCGIVGQIEDVVVHPNHRHKGLGLSLIEHLINCAVSRLCYKVVLNCADYNVPFYEKLGFRRHENQLRYDIV